MAAEQRLQWRCGMAEGERARDQLALRCIEVTRRDAHRTLSEAHPADRVELPFDIDRRALELLNRLRDQLPPDSAAWSALEELERSIDLGLVGAIPIGADTDVVEPLGEQAGATSDR
jgi:hypothetical protein